MKRRNMWEIFRRESVAENNDIVSSTTLSTTKSETVHVKIDITSIKTETSDKQRSIVKYTSSTHSSSSDIDNTAFTFAGLILLGFIGCFLTVCLRLGGCNSSADAVGGASLGCCIEGCAGLGLSRGSPVN